MLTQVEVRTSQGSLLTLPLSDISDGISLENIEGLDPVKATLVSSSFALMDGAQYQSSRREPRNILLKLGLEPDFIVDTVRTLRTRLYGYFMPKTEISMTFIDSSGLGVVISGWIESFETPLFTQQPEVDISVMCFDPDFVDPDDVVVSGNTVSTTTQVDIPYAGTVETGILFTLNINRTLTAFTLYHSPPDGSLRTMDVAGSFAAGDVLKISSVVGTKYAQLTRTGSTTSVLYAISPQSNWIELLPGLNKFRAYATGAAIPWSISYFTRYGGL